MKNRILLGVNIDHIATLRQARHTRYPDPVEAVYAAESGGADGITVHLREDRRHIQERDIELIQQVTLTRVNLEMAVTNEMLNYALARHPEHCCLVPERRAELTTEGGLEVAGNEKQIAEFVHKLQSVGIEVSLFIDPSEKQIKAAKRVGAPVIEIHTGAYADAKFERERQHELARVKEAVQIAVAEGLIVNAGHGLNYQNVHDIAAIPEMNELNIGHGIVARALFVGFENAVREMKQLMLAARN